HRLNKQLDVEVEKATETMWFFEKMRWFQFIAGLILQLGTIVYALVLFRDGAISVGSFAMVATLSLVIIDDSRGLSRRFLEFFEYMGNISDGVKILVKPHEIQDMENAKDLVAKDGALEFKDVCFSYAEGKSVFENLNVKIKPGEKVGLVGFSGSGKTTFVNLILRLFDIQEGQISIDDQNIQTHTQDSLRSSISMIPQDPVLFHRTLLENIRYGNPSATDEQVKEAARMAHAHDFILETEDGYQSLVGERGVKLSGGQRQRVAISRAILKDAPLLVMDEATSSLDSITEKAIQNTLDTIMKDKTVIVVAHRLSTISHLDRILVFNEGRIIEDGSHETLLKENGHYARLWSMQAGGFLPSRDTESTETQTPSNPRPTL
ncbi:MAG: ABC transporter ATP-binding protein, partial [Bdellovibrionaceae bacterium]|nr:ABC transporter ATP-binding protein [Pseudobdellovibrionaceae bacterium]